MRLLPVALALACTASGQAILPASQIGKVANYFDARPDDKKLGCEIKPIPAQLNFSFRIQAGYHVRLPLKQFSGPGHALAMASRVTPEGHDPIYLLSAIRMPVIPKNRAEWDLGGTFLLGEGRYKVDFLIGDDLNRICRKSWNVEVKLDARERSLNLGLAPGTVGEISLRRWSAQNPEADVHRVPRLTVLLHAAPLYNRMTRMRGQDRAVLLSSLVALLESLPANSVRLVAFNLDQQKELFRQDVLTPESFSPLSQSLNQLQLQTVDLHVLQNRTGHISLLADLVNRELTAKEPSDVVIFLGPTARYFEKFPDLGVEAHASSRFFYIQYKPNWDRGQDFPDSIDYAMKKVHGKTLRVHTPDEFARAIQQINTQLSAER
jgi:hypothetical protein